MYGFESPFQFADELAQSARSLRERRSNATSEGEQLRALADGQTLDGVCSNSPNEWARRANHSSRKWRASGIDLALCRSFEAR